MKKRSIKRLRTWLLASVVMLGLVALPNWFLKITAQEVSAQNPNAQTESLDPNDKIAFASDRDGNFEIYIMNANGGAQTRLTNNPADDLNPTWSPDGKQIAFVSTRTGNRQIWLMNSDGSNQLQVSFTGTDNLNPSWSPDGTKLLFVSNVNGNDEIFVANLGVQIAVFPPPVTNITNNQYDDIQPTWRPDGQKIAFASNRDTGKYQLYTMNPDGTGVVRLTNNAGNDLNPFWSSGRITFQSDRDGTEQLYIINGDGTNETRLTNNAFSDTEPSRASDGSFIVFTSTRDGVQQLYRVNADGSRVVRLTNTTATDFQAAVQPRPLAQTTGTVQFSNATYTVNEGAGTATITVTRTGSTAGVASVDFAATAGTASVRSDFLPVSGTLFFADGEASKTFTVSIIDNAIIQPDHTVNLTLSSANGATLGTPANAVLTIVDNDPNTSLTQQLFIARLNGAQETPPRATNAFGFGGLLLSADGTTAKVSLSFAGLTTPQTGAHIHTGAVGVAGPIIIPLPNGRVVDQQISLTAEQLQNLRNGNLYFNVHSQMFLGGEIRGQILPLTNPIDDAGFFARQQYLDFLSREPDAAGLQFWTNQQTACVSDAQCREDRRADVSAAFFLSNEFQQTGLYVYEAYRVAFGRAPRFNEFLPDAQTVGRGVIFGQPDATNRLRVNQRDYISSFVSRDAFRSRFEGKTNAQFVDLVLQNADGIKDSDIRAVLRSQFVTGLTNGSVSRADVLQRVITEFVIAPAETAEFNRAFVTFEYFGYLRRDPDEAGFNFWLNKLNQFNGDFRRAEMVKAFITSTEYRARFGAP